MPHPLSPHPRIIVSSHTQLARHYNSALSIWLSVDPMSDKYPGVSPYTYCANNPVRLVDPNGEEVYVDGESSNEVVLQINNQTSKGFSVSLDVDGKMSYKGEARTEIDKMIQNAIDDKDITVNILADNSNSFGGTSTTDGGAYMGNNYENGKVCTEQYVAPSLLADFDYSVGDRKSGLTMVHELAESYYGGQLALEKQQCSPPAGVVGSTYNEAHLKANQLAIGNRGPVYVNLHHVDTRNWQWTKPDDAIYAEGLSSLRVRIGWQRKTNNAGM